nr:hypothetical protein [Tanacetum cinerariifolium]
LDRLRESHAQILLAIYNQKNIDYVALLWEDFMYQADNRKISSARKEHMPYPRFTKVIINHFTSKDNTISIRNMINLHIVRNDTLLGTLKFVSKIEDFPPKNTRNFKKPASSKLKTVPASPKEPTQKGKRVKRPAKKATTILTTGVVIIDIPDKSASKNKSPSKIGKGKGINGNDDGGNEDDYEKNPSFTLVYYEEEEQDEEYVYTQEKDKSDDEEKMFEEEDDDVAKELYIDLNITQGLKDTDITNAKQEEAKVEIQEFINQVDSTMKKIIKEQVKAHVSKIMPKIEDYVIESQGAETTSEKIHTIAKKCYKERQPPRTFDELMGTPIDFLTFVMNCPMIDNLTQENLVGPAFNLLKGTCKSFAELEYHFEECYKAINDRHDWHNLDGLSANYFINNDLEYLKGGSSSSKYTTSTTRTKADKYNNLEGIEDMVPTYCLGNISLGIIVVTSVKVIRWYDYGYLEEIVVQRDDNVLYKFKEGDFPRLNLCHIEDMLLLLVQKKLSNVDVDDQYDLGLAR